MVTLDGSASSDPDNNVITYLWTAPMGITLSSNTAAMPTFTAPEVMTNTNYTISLVVNDGTLNSTSDQVVVTVKQVNKAPIANAGTDQSVNEGTLVTLDGSASSDPDNNVITYLWTAPVGITLSSNTAVMPTFTAPEVMTDTNYTFSLVVNDGTLNSTSDQVVVTVKQVNKAPVANAGVDQSVNEGTLVTLDGSSSSDPDNNVITYLWTAPVGITLSSNTAVMPTFTAPQVIQDTPFVFTLVVNDGTLNSASSMVTITVKPTSAILKLVSKINNVAIPSTNVWYQMYLKNGNTFMSENITPQEKGDTTVFSIPQGEWIILGLPVQNSITFLPTYVGDVIDWSNAERINIPDNGTVFRTISYILPETVSLGIGQISGNIYQNNTPGTKSISIVMGTFDTNNPLQGVLVQLYKKGGTIPIASSQTDSQGFYKFDHLELSDYEIVVEIPGFIQSERFGVTVTDNEPITSVQFSVNTNSNTITDINDQLSYTVKVYPNPNSGKFTISSGVNISSFEIYNMAGEKIITQSELNRQNSIEVDLSNHGRGIYFAKIYSRSGSITQKIIVQ